MYQNKSVMWPTLVPLNSCFKLVPCSILGEDRIEGKGGKIIASPRSTGRILYLPLFVNSTWVTCL